MSTVGGPRPSPPGSAGDGPLAGAVLAWASGMLCALAVVQLDRGQRAAWWWAAAAVLGLLTTLAQALRDRRRRGSALAAEQRAAADRDAESARSDEARRLRLLGGLAAGLAHELGQPLSAARVGIEGIHYLRQLGREPAPEHIERTLSRVGMSLLAMTQTIEHLRGLAAPGSATAPVELDLGDQVDALIAERDQWLRYHDARIDWRRPSAPVSASADAAGLRLILTNLLRNAVEAVAGQGEARRLVRISLLPGPALVVHDSGPGIPADLLARPFDPFVSSKGDGGRGIGLSLARASAQRMGARLDVVSHAGAGTTFTLHLRAAPESR